MKAKLRSLLTGEVIDVYYIDATGSISGMKKLGYWGQNDRTVKTGGTIYNISRCVVTDPLDEIARQYCRCGGNHSCAFQEVSNEMRAMYAKRALDMPPYDENPDYALVDLLTNLMHYCDQHGIEFEKELRRAREHFKAEK